MSSLERMIVRQREQVSSTRVLVHRQRWEVPTAFEMAEFESVSENNSENPKI